jgi:hypothetical protein
MPELITLAEAAELLRLTTGALKTQRWRDQEPGRLGFRVGRGICFRREDLEAWIAEQAEAVRK